MEKLNKEIEKITEEIENLETNISDALELAAKNFSEYKKYSMFLDDFYNDELDEILEFTRNLIDLHMKRTEVLHS